MPNDRPDGDFCRKWLCFKRGLGNQLIGEIPLDLFNCKKIAFLDLSANKLMGSIPESTLQLKLTDNLVLSNNCFPRSKSWRDLLWVSKGQQAYRWHHEISHAVILSLAMGPCFLCQDSWTSVKSCICPGMVLVHFQISTASFWTDEACFFFFSFFLEQISEQSLDMVSSNHSCLDDKSNISQSAAWSLRQISAYNFWCGKICWEESVLDSWLGHLHEPHCLKLLWSKILMRSAKRTFPKTVMKAAPVSSNMQNLIIWRVLQEISGGVSRHLLVQEIVPCIYMIRCFSLL